VSSGSLVVGVAVIGPGSCRFCGAIPSDVMVRKDAVGGTADSTKPVRDFAGNRRSGDFSGGK
jgi:hypothetical protein